MVLMAVPFATTPVAGFGTTVDLLALGGPGTNSTVGFCVIVTLPMDAVIVFVSALVERMVAVVRPLALVTAGVEMVWPVPVDVSTTVAPEIGLLLASSTVTVMVDVAVLFATTPVEALTETVECEALGAPGTNVTIGFCVIFVTPTVAVTVFGSALVEASVPVAWPFASVTEAGWVSVLPVVGLAASHTLRPEMPLPWLSFAVTVTVDVLVPSAVTEEGLTATVDFDALSVPAVNVTVAVGSATPPTVAVMVFVSALVDAIWVEVAPPASVTGGWGRVLFDPVEVTETVAPTSGLLFASMAVTLMVDVDVLSAGTLVGLQVTEE